MSTEIRKLKTELSLINSLDEMINLIGALKGRITGAEERISDIEDDIQKVLRVYKRPQNSYMVVKRSIIIL